MNLSSGHPTWPAPATVVQGGAQFELLASPVPPSRVEVLHVHFPAGARTRWHTHPVGQLLLVTDGEGWVQSRGRQPLPLRAGDVVHVEPGEEHWHGAGLTTALSHLAVTEHDDDHRPGLLEPVADDEHPETGRGEP